MLRIQECRRAVGRGPSTRRLALAFSTVDVGPYDSFSGGRCPSVSGFLVGSGAVRGRRDRPAGADAMIQRLDRRRAPGPGTRRRRILLDAVVGVEGVDQGAQVG